MLRCIKVINFSFKKIFPWKSVDIILQKKFQIFFIDIEDKNILKIWTASIFCRSIRCNRNCYRNLSDCFCLLGLVDGAKLWEGFPSGFWNKPPSKEGGKSAHTSMEEEDGGEAKMQDHMGDCLHQGKGGEAPGWEILIWDLERCKDPPDNLSQTGSKGPVLWSEELTNHCVRHRSNSHSIRDCCHHQGGYQANLLRVNVWGG